MAYEIGDTVILKSGGPDMTITIKRQDTDGALYYECTWFLMNEQTATHWFPIETLWRKEDDKPT